MSGATNPPWLTAEQQRIWRSCLAGVARIDSHLNLALAEFGDRKSVV